MINYRKRAQGRPVGRAVQAAKDTDEATGDKTKPQPGHARSVRIPWYYGAALLLFGVPFWPVSAWFLASGWIAIVNGVLDFLHIPAALPVLSGWIGLGVSILVGATYSLVELSPPTHGYAWRSFVLLWVAWAVVMISDVGATYRGLDRESVLGVALALVLTFVPDQAIMRGWQIVRGRSPF